MDFKEKELQIPQTPLFVTDLEDSQNLLKAYLMFFLIGMCVHTSSF